MADVLASGLNNAEREGLGPVYRHEAEDPDTKIAAEKAVEKERPKGLDSTNKKDQFIYRKIRAQRTIAFQNCSDSANSPDTENACIMEHGGKFNGPELIKRDITAEIKFQQKRLHGAKSERFAAYYHCLTGSASPLRFRGVSENNAAAANENLREFSDVAHQGCLSYANGESTPENLEAQEACEKTCLKDEDLFSDAPIAQVEEDKAPEEDKKEEVAKKSALDEAIDRTSSIFEKAPLAPDAGSVDAPRF